MLDYETGEPIIRRAIERRLGTEPGIKIAEIKIHEHPGDCIAVGMLYFIDEGLIGRSRFDLPEQFEHSHLVNEIDQVCEQAKAARKNFWGVGGAVGTPSGLQRTCKGTGLRGLWDSSSGSKATPAIAHGELA